LPTFERPRNATSGTEERGRVRKEAEEWRKVGVVVVKKRVL